MSVYISRIKSFVRREGRMTPSQARALERHWDSFGLDGSVSNFDFDDVFGRSGPRVLDIGFGDGQSLFEAAGALPDKNFIGVEVYRPGVGALLIKLVDKELSNVRVFCGDAVEVLEQCVPDNSLDKVQLFFPDPWPKKRHHKRRLVRPEFCDLVLRKLKPGGIFHLATDWENYADHMMAVVSQVDGFVNVAGVGHFSERPVDRPLTKYERRGKRLGHGVWDLLFEKA